MEKRMAIVETKVLAIETKLTNVETALIRGFNELKDVLVEMKEENTRKVRNTPSGDRENIVVAGGVEIDSVEMFNWRQRTWSPLQSMPQERRGATSFVYNNHVTIAGGWCPDGYLDTIIRMNAVKLPANLLHHSSVVYNDQLLVTGGYDGNLRSTSNCIHQVQLVPPYNVTALSGMPEPRQAHVTEIFDDSLLIAGGRTTGSCKDNLSSVVLCDIRKNECKQLAPLPYEVSFMAAVKWGENIVIIGGVNKRGEALNTVIMYNEKIEQSRMLPPMKYKRYGCTAVAIQGHIVVLGGYGERGPLKSVEAFNFENNTWQELPEMSEARYFHTAVAV